MRSVKAEEELSETDSDTSNEDSVLRVQERVAAVDRELVKEAMVEVAVRPRKGGSFQNIQWLADSGVRRTLLAETDWNRVKEINPQMKLKKKDNSMYVIDAIKHFRGKYNKPIFLIRYMYKSI